MSATEKSAGELIQQLEARERRARLTATLLTLIPALVAIVLIWFTASQLTLMNNQLQAKKVELASASSQLNHTQAQAGVYQDQLTQAQASLASTQNELASTQKELGTLKVQTVETNKRLGELQKQYDGLKKEYNTLINSMRDVRGFSYPGNPLETYKGVSNRYPAQGEMLLDMMEGMKNVPWNLGGFSPEEGFDLPSFAAYMLGKNGLLSQPAADVRYRLRDVLPQTKDPQFGDVVFYDLGYTMFYYKDEQGKTFVVGMTPLGVLALKPDFEKIIGYGRVNYPR